MSEEIEESFILSPSQGVRLMALSEMLRQGDISFRGHEEEEEQAAYDTLIDVGQEIALQVRR